MLHHDCYSFVWFLHMFCLHCIPFDFYLNIFFTLSPSHPLTLSPSHPLVFAQADRLLNEQQAPATRKLAMLPHVVSQLRKIDLIEHFLDNDLLRVLSTWLMPLPDGSLPNITIRSELIKILMDVCLCAEAVC